MIFLPSQRCKSGTWADTQTHDIKANMPKNLSCSTHRQQSLVRAGMPLLSVHNTTVEKGMRTHGVCQNEADGSHVSIFVFQFGFISNRTLII